MSETELPTGHDFVEANHGLKPAPTEPAPAEPETYGSGDAELHRAANDLTRERGSSEAEPVERFLEWKTGSRAGERVDLKAERMSLTPEAAAKALSEVHQTEDAIDAYTNLQNLANEVDLARYQAATGSTPGTEPQQQSAQAETPPPIDGPQPESSEQPSTGIDPDFAALLEKKPQLRAQLEAPFQAAEATRQAYTGAAQQIAEVALSSVLANFPELQGIPGAQMPAVLAFIQKNDPVKAQAIQNQLQQVNAVYSAAQQAKAVEAHQYQEQFKQWARAQDDALAAKVPEIATDTDMRVSKAALKSLKDVGYTEQELAAAWNGTPFSMRDHRAQLLIWKASRFDQIQATAHANPHRQLPSVQRPGIAPSAGERSNVDLSELRNEFKRASGNEQLRLAAKLQAAQRRARG